jgi:UDP-glucose 4-epimerase
MTQRNIFITGGAGFIGRWLVNCCLQDGHAVTVYDNLCAGRLANLAEFQDRITFYQADILDEEQLEAAMAETQPDLVFHLAAHHFIPFCNENPLETLRVNAEGTYAVLQQAANAGVDTAVVASSGVVYPSVDDPLTEDMDTVPPDVYGLSKLMTEQVAEHMAQTTNMTCVAARLFNTYGAYETNPHLIPHIVESLHAGPEIPLGNIYTKRDYIYVEDVANLLLQSALHATDSYSVVNVGTGMEYSAEEIVEVISDLIGTDIHIDVDQSRIRAVDKMHQRADTTRLQQLTDTKAQHSLEDGLTKLLREEQLLTVPA